MLQLISNNEILIKFNYSFYKINIESILYIEKIKETKRIKIITKDQSLKCISTIKECKQILNKNNFFLLDKSTLVNKSLIKELHSDIIPYIKFYYDKYLYISQNNFKKILSCLLEINNN